MALNEANVKFTELPFRRLALAAMLGSLAFWLPFLLLSQFPLIWGVAAVILLTLGSPLLECFALEICCDLLDTSRWITALFMLLGVWASGPFWITLENTFTPGQGFHMDGAWLFVGLTTLLFPATTFMMSAYHGSLGAVVLVIPAILVFAATNFRFFKLQHRLHRG